MATLAELDALVDANPDAARGIAAAYEVLLDGVPSIDGFVFLINNAKATNFGSNNPSITFNQENIFINLTNALIQGNPTAKASFQDLTAGGATLSDKLGAIYDAYVPSDDQTAEGRAYFTRAEAQAFYANVAAERGVAGVDGAAIVGLASLLKIIVTSDIGRGDDVNDLMAAIGDGTAVLPTSGAVFTPIETADGTKYDADDKDLGTGGVKLTMGVDKVAGTEFTAERAYTPGGTDQVNTLNDDDELTGTGNADKLNFTFVRDVDINDAIITPVLNDVEHVDIKFATSQPIAILDLQDASQTGTDATSVDVSRIAMTNLLAGVNNMNYVPTNLSINNSNAASAVVAFGFTDNGASGDNDSTKLTLNNAQVLAVGVQEFLDPLAFNPANPAALLFGDQGIEHITIDSIGSANRVGILAAEDVEDIKITGNQDLSLGTTPAIKNGTDTEIIGRIQGLFNVAGSLDLIDASTFTGDLDITLDAEVTAKYDGSSGVPVDFVVKGGSGDDTIRLKNGFDTNGDAIDGGAGDDTVQVFASVTKGSISAVENLDIRNDQSTINIDASLFTGLKTITLRNESNNLANPIPGNAVYNLNKLTAEQAANLVVQHSSTGSNGVTQNVINATLATDTAADLLGLKITDKADDENRTVNTDPRFNLTVNGAKFENVTFTDVDTESNSVRINTVGDVKGTLTVLGENQAGKFFNLDTVGVDAAFVAGSMAGHEGALQKDATGASTDGTAAGDGSVVGITDVGAGAATRFSGAKVDASAYTGDLIVRVSNNAAVANGGQVILGGKGNDHIIFDALNSTTAGLSISDTVKGGDGDDTLYLDGDGVKINVGQSEWTNVSSIETIRLVGNGLLPASVFNTDTLDGKNDAYGRNAYNLVLTNDLIANNGIAVTGGRLIQIVNDNDPVNGAGVADNAFASANAGVTIDARSLNAQSNFSYNGEEGAGATADRFIMSDANVNGLAQIDGGAVLVGLGNAASNLPNADILEVRNQSVVTIGDLTGMKNISTIFFTNDLAVSQTHYLQLDDSTVENLVNSTKSASAGNIETLTITAFDNANLPTATSILTVDGSLMTSQFLSLNVTGAGGNDILGGGAGGDVFTGGAGADTFMATAATSGLSVDLADNVMDFTTGTDLLDLNGPAGTSANFLDGVVQLDYASALLAANTALDTTVLYSTQQIGANTFVFFDSNGDGTADGSIELVGVAIGGVVAADIV